MLDRVYSVHFNNSNGDCSHCLDMLPFILSSQNSVFIPAVLEVGTGFETLNKVIL